MISAASSSALVSAVGWVSEALLGSSAASVAGLAIAGLGGLMLAGHVPARRGVAVVIGCFVLFSADVIADALVKAVESDGPLEIATVEPPLPVYSPPVVAPVPYDPYAGASVPNFSGSPDRNIFSQ